MWIIKCLIMQCANGHIACARFCQKLKNVCASCSKPTGKIRCLAIENVINSLHMCCKYVEYGCSHMLKFTKKKAHETSCPYIPYTCLVLDCSFSAAATSFPNHFYCIHQTQTVDFQYDVWFTIVLNPNDQHVVLRAVDMFLLHYDLNHALGNIVYVTFFGGIH